MLNYGEPQILELMQNTLPIRFYPILFPINNLRDAITTAKKVMIKEKIDRQKTGQTSTTPFMQMTDNNQSPSRTSKRGVTFDAMETIDRNSDSIDRLTSLVGKMNVKMGKREAPYKPRVYQGRPRGQSRNRQQTFQPCNRSFHRDRNKIGTTTKTEVIIGPTIGIGSKDAYRCDDRRNSYWSNDRQNDLRRDNRRNSYRQQTSDRGIEIGVRVERSQEITVVTNSRSRDGDRDGQRQQRAGTLSDDRDRSRFRSNSRVSINKDQLRCYRGGEYDHFAQECPNTPTDDEMGHSDTEQASLQMLTHDHSPINSNGEVEYLNL